MTPEGGRIVRTSAHCAASAAYQLFEANSSHATRDLPVGLIHDAIECHVDGRQRQPVMNWTHNLSTPGVTPTWVINGGACPWQISIGTERAERHVGG